MAVVRLSDLQIPAVWNSYGEVNSPELVAFLTSGIVTQSATLDAYARGPSKDGTLTYWNDLDQTIEPNYSNDDPADMATPQKINMAAMGYRISYLNQGWSSMDLAAELLDQDPIAQIKSRTSTYWLRRLQRRIVAIGVGVWKKNVATNSSDMTIDVSLETTVGVTDANRISDDVLIDAAYTMGDRTNAFVAIAMHSNVMKKLVKQDRIDFEKDSQGALTIPYYKGMYVVVDDGMPVIAGTTSGFRYVSMLFTRGFIGMGVGVPETPVAVQRVEAAGHGGGMETFWERKTWLLQPAGHTWVEGSLAEFSPRDSDLALAAHWTRVWARKQTGIAFLVTNG